MTLRIQLEKSDCHPGQTLDLSVHWEFESIPSEITLDLGWHTTGKGTEDEGTVYVESWTPDSKHGDKGFRIQLPRGPISVRGNLISIDWQFKCHSKKPNETYLKPIVLSHMDAPVLLTSLIK